MIFKASHPGRGGNQRLTERAFAQILPSQSAYADSSPKVGAFKFVCFSTVNSRLSG